MSTEDALMIVVMVLFVLEMVINGIVDYKTYPLCLGLPAGDELRWRDTFKKKRTFRIEMIGAG